MAELTLSNFIKIILGVFVVVIVIFGLVLFFKGSVFDFFGTPSQENNFDNSLGQYKSDLNNKSENDSFDNKVKFTFTPIPI